jgi:hypothetical protein
VHEITKQAQDRGDAYGRVCAEESSRGDQPEAERGHVPPLAFPSSLLLPGDSIFLRVMVYGQAQHTSSYSKQQCTKSPEKAQDRGDAYGRVCAEESSRGDQPEAERDTRKYMDKACLVRIRFPFYTRHISKIVGAGPSLPLLDPDSPLLQLKDEGAGWTLG